MLFDGNSTPGNAQLINAAPGAVSTSQSTGPNSDSRLTAGSIAGSGTFQLGGKELTVGGNNLSTTVTGVLTEGDPAAYRCLAGEGRHRHADAVGHQHLHRRHDVDGGTLAVNGSIPSSSGVT